MARLKRSFVFRSSLHFLFILGFLQSYQDLRVFGAGKDPSDLLKELAKKASTAYGVFKELNKVLGLEPDDQLKKSHEKLKQKVDQNDYTDIETIAKEVISGLENAGPNVTATAEEKTKNENDENTKKTINEKSNDFNKELTQMKELNQQYDKNKPKDMSTTAKPDQKEKDNNSTKPEVRPTSTAKPDANKKKNEGNNRNQSGIFSFFDFLKAIARNTRNRIQSITNALKVKRATTAPTTTTTAATTTVAATTSAKPKKKKKPKRGTGGPFRLWVSSYMSL